MPRAKPKARPTPAKMSAFRLTGDDLRFLDEIAAAVEAKTGMSTTKVNIIRGGILMMADRWLAR